jgi:hypothetical protein
MTDVQLFSAHQSLLLRDVRRATRDVSRYQATGQVRLTSIDVETDIVLAKVDSLTAVTGQGMSAVTRVAQVQRQLEPHALEASGRMALLADDHALGVLEVLGDHRRALRRL